MEYITKVRINPQSKNLYWLTIVCGFSPNQILENKNKAGQYGVSVYSQLRSQNYSLSSYDYIIEEQTNVVDISKR